MHKSESRAIRTAQGGGVRALQVVLYAALLGGIIGFPLLLLLLPM